MANHDTSFPTLQRRRTSCSRRDFLVRATVAAGAAAAPAIASAQDPRVVLDASVLNFLLRFEYVELALYENAVGRFTQQNFTPFGADYNVIVEMRDQEAAHVETLRDLVRRLGGTPLGDCTRNFPRFRTAPDFFQTAMEIEDIGVSAYLGVLPLLRTPQLQTGIASISSVESRHAAYMGLLNGQSPAPAPADTPRSRSEVLRLLDPYIVNSCDPRQQQ
jgi:hypothetical protein